MGSSVFTVGSSWVILGSAALYRYLQWVPLGFLLSSCVFPASFNGFLLGSAAPCRYLRWVPVGFLLGSTALCRYLRWIPLGFLLGSCALAAHLNGFLLGSRWFPQLCVAICSGFLLGSCAFAAHLNGFLKPVCASLCKHLCGVSAIPAGVQLQAQLHEMSLVSSFLGSKTRCKKREILVTRWWASSVAAVASAGVCPWLWRMLHCLLGPGLFFVIRGQQL